MHEPEGVHPGERAEELLDVVPRAPERQARECPRAGEARSGDVAGDQPVERVAVDVLHRDGELVGVIDERVEADHIGMRQRAHGLGLVEEEGAELGVGARPRPEDLQRDGERRLRGVKRAGRVEDPSAPNDSHSPFAEAGIDHDAHRAEVDRRARPDRSRRRDRLEGAAPGADADPRGNSSAVHWGQREEAGTESRLPHPRLLGLRLRAAFPVRARASKGPRCVGS